MSLTSLLAYIQECVKQKKWPKLVLFKRSEQYHARELQATPIGLSSSPNRGGGWRIARVPSSPRVDRKISLLSPRRKNDEDGRPAGSPIEMVEVTGDSLPEWNDHEETDENNELVAPRYDHAILADPELPWPKKTAISLWELVRLRSLFKGWYRLLIALRLQDSRVFRVRVLGAEKINERGCSAWKKFSSEQLPDDAAGSLFVRGTQTRVSYHFRRYLRQA